ncbi:hypothetical protein G5B35_26575, partial [Parapusillimonas sp. SGNA-6]|nr:hypothetical protein [Parapusillimonas sp. SGNA-6]
MKKIALLGVAVGALAFASCNNTTTKNENGTEDTLTTVGEHLDHAVDHVDEASQKLLAQAEADYNKAKEDLDAAIASGDKKAEEAARTALERAEAAWNNTKEAVKNAG